jgi:hypothetical protein
MNQIPPRPWLTTLLLTLGLTLPGSAQEPHRYVPFDLDRDYVKELNKRLDRDQQLGPFKELIKQVLADPTKLPIDATKIKDMKLEDPKFKQALQDWIDSDPKLRQSLIDWIAKQPKEAQPANVAKLQKEMQDLLAAQKKKEGGPSLEAPAPPNMNEPVASSKNDPFSRLTEQAMNQAQHSGLNEFLKDSHAFKQAFEDLRATIQLGEGRTADWGDWQSKLLGPNGKAWSGLEQSLERMRSLPRPKLDRLTWDVPGIGNLAAPNLGTPGFSDFSGPTIGAGTTWVLLAVLCLLIGWRFLSWTKRRAAPEVEVRPDLGPWPVPPSAVATRAELVQAFDYLALWTLGLKVKCWNHHAVAARWLDKSPACDDAAQLLAQLYEQARYTDAADALAENDRDAARRALLQLAEAF